MEWNIRRGSVRCLSCKRRCHLQERKPSHRSPLQSSIHKVHTGGRQASSESFLDSGIAMLLRSARIAGGTGTLRNLRIIGLGLLVDALKAPRVSTARYELMTRAYSRQWAAH